MLPLLLTLMVGQVQPDPIPRPRQYRSEGPARTSRLGQSDLAFFEAFPIGGAGTTVACSTTAPTGANSEALTFTRSSTAMCTKTAAGGLATTGIANGDLVTLATDQSRVEYDSAGALGLLVEAARTNSALRSQESDDVVWQKLSSGVAVPVVTANTAVAPDGTTTADTVAFPAVSTASNYSDILQSITLTAASTTHSEYVRGVSGSGRLYVMCTPDGVTYRSAPCDYVSTSWTRCVAIGVTTAIGWFCGLGVDLRDGSQAAQAAQSVYRWGMDTETGPYSTSYIPTTSAAVTRAAETASFPFSAAVSNAGGSSMAGTFTSPVGWSAAPFDGLGAPYLDALNRKQAYWGASNSMTCSHISTGGNIDATTPVGANAQTERLACAQGVIGSGTLTAYRNNVAGSSISLGTATAFAPTSWQGIGALSTASATGSQIISRLCYQPGSDTRCR